MQHRLSSVDVEGAGCGAARWRSSLIGHVEVNPCPLLGVGQQAITFCTYPACTGVTAFPCHQLGRIISKVSSPLRKWRNAMFVVADHLHLDGVEVEPSAGWWRSSFAHHSFCLAEGDGLCPFSRAAHHVGARGGHHGPVVLLHPVRAHLVVVLWLGPQFSGVERSSLTLRLPP